MRALILPGICLSLLASPSTVLAGQTPRQALSPGQAASPTSPQGTPSAARRGPDSVRVGTSEYLDLERLKLMQDMQADLEQWIQRRFWFLAFLAVVVGFFGTRSLVRELISEELKTATQSAADARAAADHAKESTRDVRQQADRYRDRVEALSGDAAKLDDKLKSLDQRIAAEGAHALAAAEIRIGELAEQLQELSGTVQHLSAQSTESRRIVQDYRDRVAKLQSTSSNALARFNENSAINVVVLHPAKDAATALGPRLLATLLKQGYKAAEAFVNTTVEGPRTIRIDYKTGRRQNGEEVRGIVASLIDSADLYPGEIGFEERSPVLGDPMDVRVFL